MVRRLAGTSLDQVWATLDPSARRALAAQLGAALRDLHALPLEGLADVPMLEYGDPARRCATLEELERAIFPIGLD